MATSGRSTRPRGRQGHPASDAAQLGGNEATNFTTATGRGIPLVDVPRRIMAENTFMASETHFALHLERFYNAVVCVNADQLAVTQDR